MRRSAVRLVRFALGLATIAIAGPPAHLQAANRAARNPKVIVLLADDLGYADVGFHGGTDIPTPHLDDLARGGVRCTNGYVSGPYCSPTRAGLLTGRYQQRFGHEFNPAGGRNQLAGLPLSEKTIADRLKSEGYATGLVGKWHLGAAAKFHPQRRGFDEFFGFLGGAHTYFAGKSTDILRGTEPVTENAYLTDAFAREAVAFIERHKDHPFFLELAFNAVHTPMEADNARLAKFASITDTRRRTYAGMLSALDDAVGAVMSKVRALGIEEDTLVVFLNDNGGPTMRGTTINGSRNDPLRGSKRTTLDGGIRVPFVFYWKGRLPAGRTYDRPVIQLDVLPTALAAADVEPKAEWKLDGVNLLPFLTGKVEGAPHETLYWRLGGQAAVRQGDWKLVRYDRTVDTPGATSNAAAGPPLTPFRLYNVAEDIGESRDLSAEHPDKARALLETWETWDHELAEPLWGQRPRAAQRNR